MSGVAQMRIGMSSAAPSRHLKSPTAIATRYDDIFGDVENFIVCCVGAGPGVSDSTLPLEIAVSPRSIVSVTREGRLERRLVEAGKRAARVGRLELRHGVLPQLRLADVEAAQLTVQDAAEPDVDLGRALGERLRHGQRRGLARLVERDRRVLRGGAGADGHLVELELEGVQHHLARSARPPARGSSRCPRTARASGRRRRPGRSATG